MPLVCCQRCPFFALNNCRFHLDSSKSGTARHFVFEQLQVLHAFTLEASFFGYMNKDGRIVHFTLDHLEECGKTLLASMHQYIPGRQHGLMALVKQVMKVFRYAVPARLRGKHLDRIDEIKEQDQLNAKVHRKLTLLKKQNSGPIIKVDTSPKSLVEPTSPISPARIDKIESEDILMKKPEKPPT